MIFGLKAEPPAPKRQYNRTHQLDELVGESCIACGMSAQDVDYVAPAILPECFFFKKRRIVEALVIWFLSRAPGLARVKLLPGIGY